MNRNAGGFLPGLALLFALFPASVHSQEVVLPTLPAAAEPTDAAKARASRADAEARRKSAAGNLKGALVSADEAYEAVPNTSTALIRATLLGLLGRHREAFEMLLVAVDLGPTEEERPLILEGLAKEGPACSPPLGWGRTHVNAPSATLRLSGTEVPAGRALGLPAGEHPVTAEAPGFVPLSVTVVVEVGKEAALDFELSAARPLAIPTPVPTTVKPTPRRAPVVPWILVGSGGALLAGGLACHLLALDAAGDARHYSKPIPGMEDATRKARYDSLESKATTRSIVAYALYGAGAAATVTGVVLLLVKRGDSRTGFRVQPVVGPGGFGIAGGF